MISLEDIGQFLEQSLGADQFPEEPPSVFRPSSQAVQRLGMAVAYEPGLLEWAEQERLDALFLHRPWSLPLDQLPPEIGVVMSHQPFDDRLTLGWNTHLATALGMSQISPFGEKNGHTIGMLGSLAPGTPSAFTQMIQTAFGGYDERHVGTAERITRVAVVNAMTESLVREAADSGAEIYLTGQFRVPARVAVQEMGIGVIAVGHRRCELWGLHTLAGLLHEHWPDLHVIV